MNKFYYPIFLEIDKAYHNCQYVMILACGQLDKVVHSLHSYVERFIETIKNRLMHRLLFPIA
ncbi:MAG: hypothetical protein J7K23_02465 [Thermoproteales archaeon]|nr:hypothetical protein [Thermoproteales archaeon]